MKSGIGIVWLSCLAASPCCFAWLLRPVVWSTRLLRTFISSDAQLISKAFRSEWYARQAPCETKAFQLEPLRTAHFAFAFTLRRRMRWAIWSARGHQAQTKQKKGRLALSFRLGGSSSSSVHWSSSSGARAVACAKEQRARTLLAQGEPDALRERSQCQHERRPACAACRTMRRRYPTSRPALTLGQIDAVCRILCAMF